MGATDSSFRVKAAEKASNIKGAFRSRQAFKSFIQTPDTALDRHGHPNSKARWTNEDLDPTPPNKRTCKCLLGIAVVMIDWANE